MSVKAREIVKKDSFTYKQLILVFALLFFLDIFLNYIQDSISDSMQIVLNVSVIIVTVGLLITLFTKILPRYELMVLQDNFVIYKAILLKPKVIFSVPLVDIKNIEKKFESIKTTGKRSSYTLWGIKDRLAYVVTYQKNGKDLHVFFQASKKFIDKLEKTMYKRLG